MLVRLRPKSRDAVFEVWDCDEALAESPWRCRRARRLRRAERRLLTDFAAHAGLAFSRYDRQPVVAPERCHYRPPAELLGSGLRTLIDSARHCS